jgi:hypothetical protein
MPRKLALKKLKASDLSFFQAYLNRFPQTKQKGFNLDQRVIERVHFPALTSQIDAAPDRRAAVALTLYGPGGAAPYLLMRKVLRAQKNWRLNGEAIHNPRDDPARFDSVEPEDIASGSGMPNAIKVVLLSATHAADASTHAAFSAAFPGQSMSVITEEEIERVIGMAKPPANHPIHDWLDQELLEDIGHGDPLATERLLRKRQGRGLTAAELSKAKANAERVGRDGEALLAHYFETSLGAELASFDWVADVNAVSPFDFKLTLKSGSTRHADAKSTGGVFGNPLYLSMSEVRHALTSGTPYDIYRLYKVNESGASLRIAANIASKLESIAACLSDLPSGVKVDSLSFNPDYFDFGAEEIAIQYTDDE